MIARLEMPRLQRVLETVLYVDDQGGSLGFLLFPISPDHRLSY